MMSGYSVNDIIFINRQLRLSTRITNDVLTTNKVSFSRTVCVHLQTGFAMN